MHRMCIAYEKKMLWQNLKLAQKLAKILNIVSQKIRE